MTTKEKEPIDKIRLRHTLHSLILDGLKIEDGEAILTAKAFEKILELFEEEKQNWFKKLKLKNRIKIASEIGKLEETIK